MKKTAKKKPSPSGAKPRHLEVEAFLAGRQLIFRILFISEALFANMHALAGQNPCGLLLRSMGTRPYVVSKSFGLPSERSPSNHEVDVTNFQTVSEMKDAVRMLRDTVDWINAREFRRPGGTREGRMIKVI